VSLCVTSHHPTPPPSHKVANKTAHKKQYTIKSKEEQKLELLMPDPEHCQMEMKGKHDSVNE